MTRIQKAPSQAGKRGSSAAKDIGKQVIAGLLVAAISAGAASMWWARENQLRLQILQRDMDNISSRGDRNTTSITALQLFVVSAHPDRTCLPLTSARKLGEFTAGDLHTLAAQMDRYPDAKAFSLNAMRGDPIVERILVQHKIDQNDLESYWHSVGALGQDRTHKP